jgi:[ribosomal protein S5]-alanine N-acetyltransferase
MEIMLEKFRLKHAKALKQIIDNREIKWRGKLYTSFPLADLKEYIHKQMTRKNYQEFAILFGKEFVGTICLEKIDMSNKNANVGYWVAKSQRGKGIATQAVRLAIKFGFKKLVLKRIYATVTEDNIASRKVLENAGFKKEGLLRKSVFKKGKFFNEYIYSILN